MNKIKAAIKLLKANGYTVERLMEPQETEYQKAIRTGIKPFIWPPIVMTREDLQHFRSTHRFLTNPREAEGTPDNAARVSLSASAE